MKQIIVEKNIPVNNNELADKNRKLLDEKQIFTINLLASLISSISIPTFLSLIIQTTILSQ